MLGLLYIYPLGAVVVYLHPGMNKKNTRAAISTKWPRAKSQREPRHAFSSCTHYRRQFQLSNHLSRRSSAAEGLSLGSSFMIFRINSLSSLDTSRSIIREKGFLFSGSMLCMIYARIFNFSLGQISRYVKGNGPKNSHCLWRILSSYSSWSAGTSGLKRKKLSP